MKKAVCVFLLLIFLSSLSLMPVSASVPKQSDSSYTTVEYYPDGSYGITTLSFDCSVGTASIMATGKSGTKSYTHYNSNNTALWKITLIGYFTYTGTSATCTSSTASSVVYNNAWRITKETASHSGSTATGEYTAKKYVFGIAMQTVNKTLTLTCSPTGVLS